MSSNGRLLDVSERAFAKAVTASAEVGAQAPTTEAATATTSAEKRPPKEKQSTRLLALASDADIFCTPMGEAYASITVDDHKETWPIKSSTLRQWLQFQYHQQTGTVPSGNAIQEAVGHLAAAATFANRTEPVFTRIAGHGAAVYLNLADEDWRSVEITAAGWSVVSDSPVRFRRPNGMLALPVPERGGDLGELRRFINATDDGFVLIASWLVGAFRPCGPYPILVLYGEPGCAKTTTCNVLRALIDPNLAPQRTLPCDERDLMITARNSWALPYDNLSRLSARHADAFCKLATGGGHATRALYTDEGEVIFEAQRPLLLNGIEELTTRGDLADRSIVVMLPTIPGDNRQAEAEFWAEFEQARPRLLGIILDAVASALAHEQHVELKYLPRMADFAKWATAAEPAFGWAPGTFGTAYAGNRAQTHELTLEASPIAAVVRELVGQEGFFGTASQLLARLRDQAGSDGSDPKEFPKDGPRLAGQLRRIAPNLRASGIDIDFDQQIPGTKSKRGIRIGPKNTVSAVDDESER